MRIRIISFNIHHGANRDGIFNIKKTIQYIKRFKADIIGLNEVDRYWSGRSHYLNLPKLIAARLKFYHFFSPSISKDGSRRSFGNLVLSRFPIVKKSAILLRRRDLVYCGSRWSEQRTCLVASLMLPHCRLEFFFTHLGLPEDERSRQIKKIVRNLPRHWPTVVAGDFNTRMTSRIFRDLKKILPHHDRFRGVDHIFASRNVTLGNLKLVENAVSDHPLVYAELSLRPETGLTHPRLSY